jgi:hypothetical protein
LPEAGSNLHGLTMTFPSTMGCAQAVFLRLRTGCPGW